MGLRVEGVCERALSWGVRQDRDADEADGGATDVVAVGAEVVERHAQASESTMKTPPYAASTRRGVGAFAYHGLLGYYVPGALWALWLDAHSVCMIKHIHRQRSAGRPARARVLTAA